MRPKVKTADPERQQNGFGGLHPQLVGGVGGGPSCVLRPSGNPPRSSQRGDLLACCFSLPFSMEWEAGF